MIKTKAFFHLKPFFSILTYRCNFCRDMEDVDLMDFDSSTDGCWCDQIAHLVFKVCICHNAYVWFVFYFSVYLFFLSFFSWCKDSYLFLTSSLDALCSSLKTRMRPFSCVDCQVQEPYCQSCAEKKSARETFPWTVYFVESTYGLEHLEILLRKQWYPYRWKMAFFTIFFFFLDVFFSLSV